MTEVLAAVIRQTLPKELAHQLEEVILALESGDAHRVLQHELSLRLLGRESSQSQDSQRFHPQGKELWSDWIFERLGNLLKDAETRAYRQHFFLILAYALLQAFFQSIITGPPLPFRVHDLLYPDSLTTTQRQASTTSLVQSLSVDGIAPYRLVPNVQLFCLANTILASPSIKKNVIAVSWVRCRLLFMHQRLLTETSSTLQASIYEELDAADLLVQGPKIPPEASSSLSIERAAIDIHYGEHKKARQALGLVSRQKGFNFALTGRLGKRTKYQERDISQLVVLASSATEHETSHSKQGNDQSKASGDVANHIMRDASMSEPANLKLDDDTLLDNISFSKAPEEVARVQDASTLPTSLAELDPGKQPVLQPLDSIILLQLASSITNTSPGDGLTREETLPYAQRVLDGGSSNWQVYTQALLVRSRIEGYRSRTVERGLLQLQALVDQIIAETDPRSDSMSANNEQAATFLPQPKPSESAPASERLQYVHLLTSPTRWELEVELASRWTSMGGLRTAVEIYERLEMWAEAALCWAATGREDKAKRIIRRRLNNPTSGANAAANDESEAWEGAPRDPLPSDAARLYCILGDIDNDVEMYKMAWEVSHQRYARAQRSLGRLHFSVQNYLQAADAYTKAVEVNQVNGPSWFALGCALLELEEFERAVEAFTRTVQIDDTDAEAWSNLAAALLKRGSSTRSGLEESAADLSDTSTDTRPDAEKHKRDALRAFKRAAKLKYDSPRLWDNVLTVAAMQIPPAYSDIVAAQIRLIELRGKTEGESCVDEDIVDGLVRFVVGTSPSSIISDIPNGDIAAELASNRPGSIPALVVKMITKQVVPLITRSSRLWRAVATISLWQNKPGAALDAHEKAWRATTSAREGWEHGTEQQWNEIVEATVDLTDAYESLGPKERTEGLAADTGELVAKDWRFKSRSAVRGIMGKGKGQWDNTKGWRRLQGCLDSLKRDA